MLDYDTMAEAVFREQSLRNTANLARHGEIERTDDTTTPRQRVAGLLLSLAA